MLFLSARWKCGGYPAGPPPNASADTCRGAAISGWPGPGIQPGNRPIISIRASAWTAPGRSDARQLDLTRRGDLAAGCSRMMAECSALTAATMCDLT
jgi:hypothetical protein